MGKAQQVVGGLVIMVGVVFILFDVEPGLLLYC